MAYLTAAEAKLIATDAQSVNGSFMRSDTDAIMAKIACAANKGLTFLNIDVTLHKVITQRIEYLGYMVVTTCDQRDGYDTVISW